MRDSLGASASVFPVTSTALAPHDPAPRIGRLADLGRVAHAAAPHIELLVELVAVMDDGHRSFKKAAKELERRRDNGLLPESMPVSESTVNALANKLGGLLTVLFGEPVKLFDLMFVGGPAVPTCACICLVAMGREYLDPSPSGRAPS